MYTTLKTVSAYQSLLKEDDYQLKDAGLRILLQNINLHWGDIANDLTEIVQLHKDPKFPNKHLAAILLSKIYFKLAEYDDALQYALQSGEYFNIQDNSEFTEELVNKCIEKYIAIQKERFYRKQIKRNLRYKFVVDKMIQKSFNKKQYKLPLGIAIESFDLDLTKKLVELMNFHQLIESILPHIDSMDVEFRNSFLEVIISRENYQNPTPYQYINLLIILKYAGAYENVCRLIYECIKRGELEIAYTLALQVSEMHGFASLVIKSIPTEKQYQAERKILINILQGNFKDEIHNLFLKNNIKTDPHYQSLLKNIEPKNIIAHGSALLSLSMLQAYTHNQQFIKIKQNLEWAVRCTHWAKFASIASLGLIHRNNKSFELWKKYLPESNKAGVVNHFPNGGALYGLGLVYTGTRDQFVENYIIQLTIHPEHSQNEVVMHGASLGLGLTAFASKNQQIGQRLKDLLNVSNSVIGQAAALGIGLVYAGSNDEGIIAQLINLSEETEHEKIIRSTCLAIALISFQSPSTNFLENLQKNQTLKLAVPLYIAMAYFKSSNPAAIRKLLYLSNDISNEVKRTAIIALGFVLYHDQHLLAVVKMLIHSYNPFIRYGCALALAVGARDSKQALDIIWPLLTDPVDYVRQAAFISIAIFFQIQNPTFEPRITEFRKLIEQSITKKHQQQLSKMGAILAIGLLDIGGRNMMVSLTTRSGIPKLQAIAGMFVFINFWNWYPYVNFIGLTLTPSAYIGVTTKLKIPKSFELKSNCKPSLFDYPPNIVKQEKKDVKKTETKVELSTTIKAKARAQKKKQGEEGPELGHNPSLISRPSVKQVQIVEQVKQEIKQQKKQEPLFSILKNPTRLAEKQRKHITFVEGRYTPILPQRKIGISFLKDSTPNLPDEYLQENVPGNLPVKLPPIKQDPKKEDQKMDEQVLPEAFDYEEQQNLNKKN